MLTTTPHLHTRRPSPTTVEYTVSTRPLQPTLAQHLVQFLVLLLRIALGVATLVVLHTKWRTCYGDIANNLERHSLVNSIIGFLRTGHAEDQNVWSKEWPYISLNALAAALSRFEDVTPAGRAAALIASQLPSAVLIAAASGVFYVITARLHLSESLLVVRGLGIQTQSTGRSWLWSGATRFIPMEKIQDVLVNEAFRGFEVRYYLIVVVEGEEDVLVVFPGLLPRRHIVETVWRGARNCLYGPQGRKKKDASERLDPNHTT